MKKQKSIFHCIFFLIKISRNRAAIIALAILGRFVCLIAKWTERKMTSSYGMFDSLHPPTDRDAIERQCAINKSKKYSSRPALSVWMFGKYRIAPAKDANPSSALGQSNANHILRVENRARAHTRARGNSCVWECSLIRVFSISNLDRATKIPFWLLTIRLFVALSIFSWLLWCVSAAIRWQLLHSLSLERWRPTSVRCWCVEKAAMSTKVWAKAQANERTLSSLEAIKRNMKRTHTKQKKSNEIFFYFHFYRRVFALMIWFHSNDSFGVSIGLSIQFSLWQRQTDANEILTETSLAVRVDDALPMVCIDSRPCG